MPSIVLDMAVAPYSFAFYFPFNRDFNALLTDSSFGKAAATSDAKRTMFVPAAFYSPRAPLFQMYLSTARTETPTRSDAASKR